MEWYSLPSSVKLLLYGSADGLADHDDDDKQLVAVCVATLALQGEAPRLDAFFYY